jgi:hypothetical protein
MLSKRVADLLFDRAGLGAMFRGTTILVVLKTASD